ncbi:diacylglycerol kinase family lipid kinase [Pseudoflavonifractor sp. 524-17]|uniref:diacylglycerol/lipid kinase family protein n=1 Tax=Pseudoflavonifractor sp. 524-17 TaxID=2304577 RepID=UPI00137B6B80|nr:diacylglycerol kinase family protein [Pseudoflavonifractor sp. 524-17]NCE63559.1 diacylglycerol kinase family lipid kinase [Pseudoflavonifractor sp. 524-17]
MNRLLFLYNPHAGKGQMKSKISDFADCFTKAGWLVTIRPTQGRGDATDAAAALGEDFDRVVCCGGDGTLHEVANGLMRLTRRPPLGYIPAGTTNDFSQNLHLPRGLAARAETAAAGVPRSVDAGRFNRSYFIYVAAFGAFTDVAYGTPQPFKNMFGHLAYLLEGATRLTSLQSSRLRVEHDGGTVEGDFLFGMVSNTVSVGGFRGLPSRKVKLDDGLFEAVLIRQPTNAAQLQSIVKALLQAGPDDSGTVLAFHTARLRVTCAQAVPWTLDGEFGGAHKTAEIENLPRTLTIIHGK